MPDIAEAYLHGIEVARAGADARQRLALERTKIQQEAQARSAQLAQQTQAENATNQRQMYEQQARLQTQAAYHDAEIALAQERINVHAQAAAEKSKAAALKMADQHGFADDLAKGMPIEQALYRHPNASPASAIAAHKDTLDLASGRLEVAKKNLELRGKELEMKQGKAPRAVRTGYTEKTDEEGNKSVDYKYGLPPGVAPPGQAAPQPLPASKAALAAGQTYLTKHGPALWDGTQFQSNAASAGAVGPPGNVAAATDAIPPGAADTSVAPPGEASVPAEADDEEADQP